ncbi:MAG: amidohydrolase family protein [Planctomycetes bacterium]|nr:amidohydrolase family protein [Planctomycetota bacterium]
MAMRKVAMVAVALALLLGGLFSCGCGMIYDTLGGAFDGRPAEMDAGLSPGARDLLSACFAGIDESRLVDFHVHMLTRDVHPDWLSWWHPFKRARTMVYLSSAAVELTENLEADYAARLRELARARPNQGRFLLLALDRYHEADGSVDLDRTTLCVPNDLVWRIASEHPDVFIPAISIHPYRKDALQELERWGKLGCRFVKWIPNAMNIDPSSGAVEPFYAKMLEHDMILLSHTGEEHAVKGDDLQHLGNPLLLRKPLDMGLKVVALHGASLGEEVDLDDAERDLVPGFDLFLRLLEDPRYEGRLFGEISAITFINRKERPLLTLLEREDLQRRLVNGSDYPLPATNVLVHTSRFVSRGYLTEEEGEQLNEIYNYNPLLFDFALKRTLKHPDTGKKLAASVFMAPEELLPVTPPAVCR